MTDKVELIKAKVEEKINLYERLLNAGKGGGAGLMSKIVALQGVLIDINFIQIDSLPEEPVSKDLEEACDSYYDETWDEHGGRAMVVDGCHDIWFPSHATDDFFKAGAQWQKEHSFSDPQINENIIYAKGYKQAEKDNALTWEDISIIRWIMYDYNKQIRNEMAIPKEEEYCKEVLKRFLEQKGGKV